MFHVNNFDMTVLKRREHLTEQDIRRNKQLVETFRNAKALSTSVEDLVEEKNKGKPGMDSLHRLATV